MKPLPERLNDRLEREVKRTRNGGEAPGWLASPLQAESPDPEVDELVTLARHVQSNPHLHANPDFAQLLERRLLMHHGALNRKEPAHQRFFPRLWQAHPALGVALGICLLVLLLGTSMLVVAAQVTNPANPLSVFKHWQQHVQVSLTNSSENRAEWDLQAAKEQLHRLAGLANAAHEEAYLQALSAFDQQVSGAESAIQALPAGPHRERLSNELTTLDVEARYTLRGWLPQLDVPQRLITTDALGRLGETVPHLLSVEIVLPAPANGQATISISGDNIQPGAQLLVDGQIMEAQGTYQNGLSVFTTNWSGSQHPASIGILNPDDTAAQTTVITMTSLTNGSNGNNGEHGNGKNGRKPTKTPPPHH